MFKHRLNDSGSTTGSIDISSPPDSPRFERKYPPSETVTSKVSTENKPTEFQPTIETFESAQRNEQNEVNNFTTSEQYPPQEEELPIPPEFVDHYADVKVKWRKMDDEPLLYRDKYIAITKTYLYI